MVSSTSLGGFLGHFRNRETMEILLTMYGGSHQQLQKQVRSFCSGLETPPITLFNIKLHEAGAIKRAPGPTGRTTHGFKAVLLFWDGGLGHPLIPIPLGAVMVGGLEGEFCEDDPEPGNVCARRSNVGA